jgi:flagella basal body P-ring formation protein FlgA
MVLALVCLLSMAGVQGARASADVSSSLQAWIDEQMQVISSRQSMPLRLEVEAGQFDPRLRLAPCEQVQPFLPPGATLWGRTRIGVRCLQGARWQVYLPVHVRAFGPGWVVQRHLPAGSVLTMEDVAEGEVEWTAHSSPVMADPQQWLGMELSRSTVPGVVLRQGMVRAPQVFPAGAKVKVVIKGDGFAVSNEARSLSAGQVGRTVRVRLSSGRMLSGEVLQDGTVQLSF